jgi:hypothetical protein
VGRTELERCEWLRLQAMQAHVVGELALLRWTCPGRARSLVTPWNQVLVDNGLPGSSYWLVRVQLGAHSLVVNGQCSRIHRVELAGCWASCGRHG